MSAVFSPHEAQTFNVEPGTGVLYGARCPSCKESWDTAVPVAFVSLQAASDGAYPCAGCGHPIHANGSGPPRTGTVHIPARLGEGPDGNPYLNPFLDYVPHRTWHPSDLNDLGNARRLVQEHGHKFRHVHEWGYLVYDGRRWDRDNIGAINRYAKHVVQGYLEEANRLDPRDETAQLLVKHHSRSAAAARINAMVDLARSEPGISLRPGDFDRVPHHLNTITGVVDLRTGDLDPHAAEQFHTRLIDVPYDPDADCGLWEHFLETMTLGDRALLDYLHAAVGYSLTGEVSEQCLFFLYGDGANGKSTFLEAVRSILGDYGGILSFETLLASKNNNAETSLAGLPGRRFVTGSESGESRRFNEELVKALTGGDMIRARHMYHEAFEFRPTAKIWLAANHRPGIHGADEGIWRRFHLVPCQADIPKERRDPKLLTRLMEERAGILAWAVRGAQRWYAEGLRLPGIMTEALAEYRRENDVLSEFLADCCQLHADEHASSSAILRAYNAWAKQNHERPLTQRALGDKLRKHRGGLLRRERDVAGRVIWRGLRVAYTPSAPGYFDPDAP